MFDAVRRARLVSMVAELPVDHEGFAICCQGVRVATQIGLYDADISEGFGFIIALAVLSKVA